MELKICHLYPDVLNLYGDGGNVICMRQRLQWRGIDAVVDRCCIGDSLHAADYDLFFIGGGQDFEQEVLLQDLGGGKAEEIRAAVRDGKTFLAICGGYALAYQMLLDLAGIESYTVSGKLYNEYHMWNCVRIDGAYYYCDATSDRGRTDALRCFMLTEEELSALGSHTWDAEFMHKLTNR